LPASQGVQEKIAPPELLCVPGWHAWVGALVGEEVGALVGELVGDLVGDEVGALVGEEVGALVGELVGVLVGLGVGGLHGGHSGSMKKLVNWPRRRLVARRRSS
jgi:hypothetical protein